MRPEFTWALATVIALAFFGLIAFGMHDYQRYQHQERMACIAEHGVFTDSGCAWGGSS